MWTCVDDDIIIEKKYFVEIEHYLVFLLHKNTEDNSFMAKYALEILTQSKYEFQYN